MAARLKTTRNGQRKRTILWQPRRGLSPPFPRVKLPLGSRHHRYYRDLPPKPFCRGAAAARAAGTRCTKGARGLRGAGATPAGVARCKLGKAQPPAPPPPASPPRPRGTWTHRGRPARRRLGSADRLTDARVDGGGGSRNGRSGSGRAAEALPRPRYVTMRPGRRRRSPGPPTGALGAGAAPGRPGAEPEPGDAGRGAGAPPGTGARLHRRGRGSRRAPCARPPKPELRVPLRLSAGDPPRPPHAPPAPPPRPPAPVREPALPSPPLSRVHLCRLRFSAAGLLLSSPPTFCPRFPLSPPPPAPHPHPARRPLPLEMKSPLTGIHASAAATSLVPKPVRRSSLNREKGLGEGKQKVGTVLGHC